MLLRRFIHSGWSGSTTDHILQDPQHDKSLKFQSTYRTELADDSPCEHGSVENSSKDPASSPRSVLSRGWRVGGCIATGVVLITLVINITIAVWLNKSQTFEDGLTTLFSGDCDKVQSADTWVHLAINVLSTLMLAGSNFMMQVLIAPTRNEINQAHRNGKWLDIGVPSMRNLTSISKIRALFWLVLGFSSIPLHLLFNSAFYPALAANDYLVLFTTEPFLHGANFTNPSQTYLGHALFEDLRLIQQNVSQWQRLENAECIKEYSREIVTNRRNLVIVTSNATSDNNTLLYLTSNYWTYADLAEEIQFYDPYQWLCEANTTRKCYTEAGALLDNSVNWSPSSYRAAYCMSEKVSPRCSLNFNRIILIAVIVCNTLKATIMIYVVCGLQFSPVLILGDAIESFMRIVDPTTQNMCLLSSSDVSRFAHKAGTRWPVSNPASRQVHESATFSQGIAVETQPRRWHNASRIREKVLMSFVIASAMVVIVAFLIMGLKHLPDSSPAHIWALGLGSVSGQTTVTGGFPWLAHQAAFARKIQLSSIIVNLPQLVLSYLYFSINGFLTRMFMADEWSEFAVKRQPLRVSCPTDCQRNMYFLQLPYRVTVPLLTLSALLHWILSKAIFLEAVISYGIDGSKESGFEIATCGYSPLAIIIVIALGFLVISLLIWISFRRFNAFIPLVSSCSAAIAASCHVPPWEEEDAVLKPLQWGVVKPPDNVGTSDMFFNSHTVVGHCTFSSGEVEQPIEGQLYAGFPHDENADIISR